MGSTIYRRERDFIKERKEEEKFYQLSKGDQIKHVQERMAYMHSLAHLDDDTLDKIEELTLKLDAINDKHRKRTQEDVNEERRLLE